MGIRILLADDHTIVRDGLRQAFHEEGDMEVVGQVGDGHAAVEKARELRPDIVVMDINMPNLNGIEATRQIQREAPGVRVIALSMHAARPCIKEVFRAGAAAYLHKNCGFEELAHAVRTVAEGKTYVSPSISQIVVEELGRTEDETASTAFSLLTPREREILQRLAEGGTVKQIAQRLHVSHKTVEAHRLRIMNKLNVDTVAQLTKYAIQEGLTTAEL
ncbi:MAG: response regulator transcription factor [Planctomycetes bacterium]|nr:response regulator transcription factor [Planctomycetota bacterium]